MTEHSHAVALLVNKDEIKDVIMRYARGTDRKDWDLVRSCYHDDAYDDHGPYQGDADGLIEWMKLRHQTVETSMHFIGNMLIELDGDIAFAESYVLTYQRLAADSQLSYAMFGADDNEGGEDYPQKNLRTAARYVDRFERRNSGPWKIAHRIVAADSGRLETTDTEMELEATWTVGKRSQEDALYGIRKLR